MIPALLILMGGKRDCQPEKRTPFTLYRDDGGFNSFSSDVERE